jgi:hypothetical protein
MFSLAVNQFATDGKTGTASKDLATHPLEAAPVLVLQRSCPEKP